MSASHGSRRCDRRADRRSYLKGSDSGLRHRLRGTLCLGERDIDDEDATFAGHIADTDFTAVRPYCFPSHRKSEAEARSIATTPVAKLLKQIALARRHPTAL